MKKLALAVAAAAISSQAMAVEIYSNDTDSLEVYGEIRARFQDKSSQSSEFDGSNTRIGIKGQYGLGNDMYAVGNVRMYGDYNSNADVSFDRGYVGVGHNEFGEVRFGKMPSVHDDLFGYDISWVNGGAAMMGNDQFSTDVVSSAAQYEWNSDSLRVMAQIQGRTDTSTAAEFKIDPEAENDRSSRVDEGYALGATWSSDFGLSLTGAYTAVELVELGEALRSMDVDTFGLEANYAMGNMSFAAAYFTQEAEGNNKRTYHTEATGFGANARFDMDNGIGFYGVYDFVETTSNHIRGGASNKKQEVKDTTYTVGADFWPHQQVVTFVEYAHNKEKNNIGSNDTTDNIAIGARFYF